MKEIRIRLQDEVITRLEKESEVIGISRSEYIKVILGGAKVEIKIGVPQNVDTNKANVPQNVANDELPWETEEKRVTPSVTEGQEYIKALEIYCFQNDVEDEGLLSKQVKEYIRRDRKSIIAEAEGREERGVVGDNKPIFFDEKKTMGEFKGSLPKPVKKKKKKR